MKCAIMQPTFLGWAGFYHLINSVDVFVWLDDVAFDRRSWQSRNRILTQGEIRWLTCPVVKAPRHTLINQIELVDPTESLTKIQQTLTMSYSKAPAKSALDSILSLLHNAQYHLLSELNQALAAQICQQLNIITPMLQASELACAGAKSHKLHAICHHLGCDEYVSPQGAKAYIEAEGVFASSSIDVSYHDFAPLPYSQMGREDFVSHLSIVDVLANLGLANTENYIKDSVYA